MRVTAFLLASLMLVAACGSQLDPETVARAEGQTSQGTGTTSDGSGTSGDGIPGQGGAGDVPGTGGTGGSTGSGGTGSGGSGDGTTDSGGGHSATGGKRAASCAGFDNSQPGVSEDKIVIANASDISGPVPGIFESAQQATRAYVEYFNSTSDICGHKLEVKLLDSRTDAGADQQAYATACADAFAAVGSMSAFDSGGAATAEKCGLPDIRSTSVTPARGACSTCFATQSVKVDLVPSALPSYFVKHHKDATRHVGLFYINAGAAVPNAESFRAAWEKGGWNIDVFQGIDVSEFNFAPYVQQMKDEGIKMVIYLGPYQNTVKLQQAMSQQGFEADVFLQDATIYDARYVEQAGDLGDGTYVYSSTDLFDNYSNKEMALYRAWLDQVKPGAIPNFYGLYAWSAARLFVEQAVGLGGKLTRASLVQSLRGVKDWTGNGLHVPQPVGSKSTYNCLSIFQLNNAKWRKLTSYQCGPLINSGTGG